MLKVFRFILILLLAQWQAMAQNTLVHVANVDFRTGIELLDKKKYGAAREFFERYAAGDGESNKRIEAEYYVAYSALNLFNPDAEILFQNFITRYPYHSKASSAYYDLATFYYNNKKYDKTIEYMQKVSFSQLSFEQGVEAKFRLGYSYFSQKDFEKAAPLFNQIKTSDHKYTYAASYYAAYLEYRNEDYTPALSDLKRAEQSEAYKNLVPVLVVNIYYKKGDYDEMLYYAENVLKKGEKLQGVDEIYLMTADAYFRKRKYKEAADSFTKYLSEFKKKPSPEVQYRLAYSYYQLQDYQKSSNNFKEIASIQDSLGQAACYYLGLSYLKLNNKEYAYSSFNQARKPDYNLAVREEALFHFAQLAYELEKTGESVQALKQFSKTYPKSKHNNEVQDLFSDALLRTNNFAEGLTYIEQLPNRSTKVNLAYQKLALYRGMELFNADKHEEAIVFLSKSLENNHDDETYINASFWKGEALSAVKNYPEAINAYSAVFQKALPGTNENYLKSRYGIGYAYYNTQQYDKALPHFRQYITEKEKVSKSTYNDALLRLADLYYVTKQYYNAIQYYDLAIVQSENDKDYAHLQKGLVMALQGQPKEALASFEMVIKNYPKSIYLDDAVFQKAELDLESSNYSAAIIGYTKIISGWPTSGFVPFSLLKRAVSYSNLDRQADAVKDYKVILETYSDHAVAKNALLGLQGSLASLGRSEELSIILEKYKLQNPTSDALVTVEFDNAKSLYNDQKYTQAITAFNNYATTHPGNPNEQELKFYLGESYFRLKDYSNASLQHQAVIKDLSSSFYNRSVQRLAEIEFTRKSFHTARTYFQMLAGIAKNKKERLGAWAGLLETYFLLNNLDSSGYFANQIISAGNASADLTGKAILYQGKIELQKQNYDQATDYFIAAINNAQDINAAEAQYWMAMILNKQGKYKQSNETLYDLNNLYSEYPQWLGKSFLLIADNFLLLKEDFQAKATLNSIIEKSPDAESVQAAKTKLEELEIKEVQGNSSADQ